MEIIQTSGAPVPAGHYSQAIVANGFVFVAGQLPLDARTGEVVDRGDVAAQTRHTLANVSAILNASGSSLAHVVSMTIYVTDLAFWPEVNRTYAEVLGEHRPARAVVPVPALKAGCSIEIQAIAVRS